MNFKYFHDQKQSFFFLALNKMCFLLQKEDKDDSNQPTWERQKKLAHITVEEKAVTLRAIEHQDSNKVCRFSTKILLSCCLPFFVV